MELSQQIIDSLLVIQWTFIVMVVSLWGVMIYSFCLRSLWHQRRLRRRRRRQDRQREWIAKQKPFTLEQMNKDLAGSTRPKTDCPESEWD